MKEMKRILVPLDGSRLAEQALPFAMTLADALDSRLFIIRVIDIPAIVTPAMYPEIAPVQMVEIRDQAREDAETFLQDKRDDLSRKGFDVESVLVEGSPAEQVIQYTEKANIDLVVMSTHGRSGLSRWALGSVADRIVRHGHCPVMLIRARNDAE